MRAPDKSLYMECHRRRAPGFRAWQRTLVAATEWPATLTTQRVFEAVPVVIIGNAKPSIHGHSLHLPINLAQTADLGTPGYSANPACFGTARNLERTLRARRAQTIRAIQMSVISARWGLFREIELCEKMGNT